VTRAGRAANAGKSQKKPDKGEEPRFAFEPWLSFLSFQRAVRASRQPLVAGFGGPPKMLATFRFSFAALSLSA
jgi:hypothetical protein